jgi:winged helix-turn helix protein
MPKIANSPQRLRSGEGKRQRAVGPSTARARLRAILPILRFRARHALGQDAPYLLPSGKEVSKFDEVVRLRARQARVSPRTIFRWLDRFEHGGYAALADQHRKDRGTSKFFSNRPLVVAFVTVCCLDGWHVATIRESLRQEWSKLCSDGSPLPHLSTLREFLKSMIPARVLAREHRDLSPSSKQVWP